MYREELVTISKSDDGGYIIMLRVRRKKDENSSKEICCGPGYDDKTLLAKDVAGVKAALDKALPMMKTGGLEEEEFKKAFAEVAEED